MRTTLTLDADVAERLKRTVDGLQPDIDPNKMNQFLDELESGDLARKHRG
jgi:hypothetical protein